MFDLFVDQGANAWIGIGFLLLALELLLLNMSTVVLLFAGLGAIATGLMMHLGVLPTTLIAGVASFGLTTGLVSALLWRPFRALQANSTVQTKQPSDFIGYEFVLDQDLSATKPAMHRYSGIAWRIELDSTTVVPLKAGQRVKVVSLDAGVFRVRVVE